MKITLVTCVLNRASTIADALDSVRAQTHPDIEHIIVDGGSRDGTLQIIEQRQSPGLRLFTGKDAGLYDALNKGVALATGDVIGVVHSDDWLAHRTVIADVASAFRPGVQAVYGDLDYVSATRTDRIVRHWKAGAFQRPSLAWGWMPPHPSLFVRRSALAAVGGYDVRYRIAADYDLILKLFSQPAFGVAYIPDVLVKMRLGGASNQSWRHIFQKSFEDYSILRSHGVGGLATLGAKNIRKLSQFTRRS